MPLQGFGGCQPASVLLGVCPHAPVSACGSTRPFRVPGSSVSPPFSYRDPPADLEPSPSPGSNFRILNLIMSAKTLFPGKATFRAPRLRTRTYFRNHSSAQRTQQGVRDSFGGRVFCKGWQGCRLFRSMEMAKWKIPKF